MLCAEARIDTAFFPYGPGSSYAMIHNDHLATPQKMTDSSGTVVWSADYKPFGEATVTVSTITNNIRFPGQYFDIETGLHYNYFRDYNPVIARYEEADPIGIVKASNHLYVYVDNKPIRFIDPEGKAIWICSRPTNFGIGNHAYLWDSTNPRRPCGMRGSSGNGDTSSPLDIGPFEGGTCNLVPDSSGREQPVMECCRETANNGPWIPGIHDCHNAANSCLTGAGLTNPGAPGGRFGPRCTPPPGSPPGQCNGN